MIDSECLCCYTMVDVRGGPVLNGGFGRVPVQDVSRSCSVRRKSHCVGLSHRGSDEQSMLCLPEHNTYRSCGSCEI